jgi:sodium-dependent dicarboxylate transporter 2/3/5
MDSPTPHISPVEENFELWRRRLGLMLGPAIALAVYTLSSGMPVDQRRLAAVLTLVMIFWVTEAIPIPSTALLGPSLCVLFGVADARSVFHPFASPIIFVFLGGFLLARAMTVNGLDRRVAIMILRSPSIGKSPERIRIAVGAVAALLSMWISNTATAAILFPIVLGISNALESLFAGSGEDARRRGRSYSTGLLLMVAYASSIGGLATPIGTPPNLIGIGMIENLAGRRIPFFEWMLLGLPIALVMFLILALLLRILHPPPRARFEGLDSILGELANGIQVWGRGQTFTLIAFLTAVVLWISPGAVALLQGRDSPLYQLLSQRLQEGVVALLAASLLFLLPVTLRPLRGSLTWKEAVQIDWGTILLFGGGLSLGGLMSSSGLAERLAQSLLGVDGTANVWVITALATIFSTVITETTSNTASASMVIPVAIAVAQTAGVSPLPPAIGATLGASLAFVLPVSTPPNAIMYGSGRVSILSMVRAGVWVEVVCYGAMLLLLWLLCGLLGMV